MSQYVRRTNSRGFTLIEMTVVIALIIIISGVAISRFDSLFAWKQKGDIRKFIDTWEFLFSESQSRGQAYRLFVNIDDNSYRVLKEVRPEPGESQVTQVDYLKNLRTKGEQARRAEEEKEELLSLEEEYKIEDRALSGDLEEQFFKLQFGDPNQPVRLARLTENRMLAEEQELSSGLEFVKVRTIRDELEDGEAFIRFSPNGASEFAVVYVRLAEDDYTIHMDPATGKVKLQSGDIKIKWMLGGER